MLIMKGNAGQSAGNRKLVRKNSLENRKYHETYI